MHTPSYMDFTFWLITGTISVAFIVIWWFTRMTIKRILEELQSIRVIMKEMSDSMAKAEKRTAVTIERLNQVITRLNDHGKRLRAVERTQDACKHCGENKNEG